MYRGSGYGDRGSNSRGRGGHNKTTGTQPRGVFADGLWQCDCSPRLPAEHFKVKKEGKNQGRWFYTCQKAQAKCGFFLWDEDAKPREEAAVLSNSRSEPGAQTGWDAGRSKQSELPPPQQQQQGRGLFAENLRRQTVVTLPEDEETASEFSPPPEYSTIAPASRTAKRSPDDAELDDSDDDFDMALDSQADELEKRAVAETPKKAQKTGVYATPATSVKRRLPWLEQPPTTPATENPKTSDTYFQTPSKAPGGKAAISNDEPATPQAPPTIAKANRTPSPPARHRDALNNPTIPSNSLSSEVMGCLTSSRINLPSDALTKLRGIVTRHDLKTQGIVKGRDISRLAIKAKDAKIAELQARIASLEAERGVERGVSRMRRWEKENGQHG